MATMSLMGSVLVLLFGTLQVAGREFLGSSGAAQDVPSQPAKSGIDTDVNAVLINDGSMTLSRGESDPGDAQRSSNPSKARLNSGGSTMDQAGNSRQDDESELKDDSSIDVARLQNDVDQLQDEFVHGEDENFSRDLGEPETDASQGNVYDTALLQSKVDDIQDELLAELTLLKALSPTDQMLAIRIRDVAGLQKVVQEIQDQLTHRHHEDGEGVAVPRHAANDLTRAASTSEQVDPEVIMVLLQKLKKHTSIFRHDSEKLSMQS